MAVSPDIFDKSFKDELATLENSLDSKLVKCRPAYGKVTVNIPIGMSARHFKVLRERYLEAGWEDVLWNSDQRDGDFLTFTSSKLE